MADLSGKRLGQYRLIEQIGQGGMANVYRAAQPSMRREVAIKVLPREFLHDPTFLERFTREVQVIAQLEHPAILPVHDFGEQDGMPFIVMRYVRGGSLADLIRRYPGGLPLDVISRLVEQIASGMDYAHRRGIIHRDFKPANVLLDEEGHAYLTDFGIAKVTETTAQLTGSGIIGTPHYMAPEMTQPGSLTPLVDVYALGVTLFQMLAGVVPYEADTPMGILVAHTSRVIPNARLLRPDLPPRMQGVIMRAMAKDPARRYQSAGELAADLHAVVMSAPAAHLRVSSPEHAAPAVAETDEDVTVDDLIPPPPRRAVTPPPRPVEPAAVDDGATVDDVEAAPSPAPFQVVRVQRPARRGGLPGWLWIGAGLLAAALVIGVLVLAGAFGGGQEAADEPAQADTTGPTAQETASAPTAAASNELAPYDGPVPEGALASASADGTVILWDTAR